MTMNYLNVRYRRELTKYLKFLKL